MRIIAETFVIRRVDSSPFKGLPWYFNSQVFLVATPA
jgi:hypothetical protein